MRNENLLVNLGSLSIVRATGADAKTFLDAQFTNDVDLVTAQRSQLSAWCNAQGRILALFRVFLRDDAYHLMLPASLRDDTIKRLRIYVLRAKVVIEPVDHELGKLGLTGPDAESLLNSAVGFVPAAVDDVITRDGITVLRIAGIHPRFEIIAPPAQIESLQQRLESAGTPREPEIWAWHDIMAGIPTILPQTREEFVPQMANLELIGAVHFKKGCYPGQEIVARMQYLGRLKQRMMRAHYAGEPVTPGTRVYRADAADQAAGTVVDAQPSPDGGADMLAVIYLDAAGADLRVGSAAGPALTLQPLPYSLPK